MKDSIADRRASARPRVGLDGLQPWRVFRDELLGCLQGTPLQRLSLRVASLRDIELGEPVQHNLLIGLARHRLLEELLGLGVTVHRRVPEPLIGRLRRSRRRSD
jgi:hypothetical protein